MHLAQSNGFNELTQMIDLGLNAIVGRLGLVAVAKPGKIRKDDAELRLQFSSDVQHRASIHAHAVNQNQRLCLCPLPNTRC